MSSQKLVGVLIALCITSLTKRVSCCSGQVSLTSSVSGRNACPSEEVTFTCTAQTTAVFWKNKEFGEKTMHHTSPRSGGDFRAEIVSYQQNCLVSSLSFRATASRNGTTVTCTSRNRSSSQSLSLHIMNVALENFTVVPEPNSTVQLGWKVTPTDGQRCISNYNIQITGPNGSQWEEQIPGSRHSYHFTGIQLLPLQEYTYCVTANLLRGQIDLKLTVNFTELQEPHPPTNLSAVIQCKQWYEIQIDWQPPLSTPLAAPVTGYLLQYRVYDNTSTIDLPALNTSYTLESVPSGAVYTITVSAFSDVGSSTNNPSVQFTVPSLTCMEYLATPEGSRMEVFFTRAMTDVESTDLDSNTCVIDVVVPSYGCNCTNLLQGTNTTDSWNRSCAGLPANDTSMDTIILCSITALTSGVVAFSCGFLFATLCKCVIIRRKNLLKMHNANQVSKHLDTVSQKREQSPQYEEIPLRKPPLKNNGVEVQQNIAYGFHKPAQNHVTINS